MTALRRFEIWACNAAEGANCASDAAYTLEHASADLVTCYIGLHHAPPDGLEAFVRSIERIVRPGGVFVLRDHDVTTPEMDDLVSLAHTVFNAGLGLPWSENRRERRHFASIEKWVQRLESIGFVDLGRRLRQANDPTDNLLLGFRKPDGAGA